MNNPKYDKSLLDIAETERKITAGRRIWFTHVYL